MLTKEVAQSMSWQRGIQAGYSPKDEALKDYPHLVCKREIVFGDEIVHSIYDGDKVVATRPQAKAAWELAHCRLLDREKKG